MEKSIKENNITTSLITYSNLFNISSSIVEGDNSIINEYICILCLNIAYKPLLNTCCSRIFCFPCCFKLYENKGKCPFCYSKEIKFEVPNKLIMRILNSFKLNCPLNNLFENDKNLAINCQEHIFYSSFHDHLLNKCLITKMIKDNSNTTNYKFLKSVTDEIKLEANQLIKNLRLNFLFCLKCQLIDKTNEHNCNDKKVFNVNVTTQNLLIPCLALNKSDPNKNEPIKTILHHHNLFYTNFRSNSVDDFTWNCDFCLYSIYKPSTEYSYNCKQCDLDICSDCFVICLLKKPVTNIHEHELHIREDKESWSCDICASNYGTRKSFHCSECDFDACIYCFYDT